MDRRIFLRSLALGTGLAAAQSIFTRLATAQGESPNPAKKPAGENSASSGSTATSSLPHPPETRRGDMIYRKLGDTGEQVSRIGVGGAHIGRQPNPEDSIRIIRTAIDRGVNFMDNSWDYNGGESEIRMGRALQDGYRDKVFLMTKVDGRDKKTAMDQLNDSLKRLQTDHIDLWQFHEVIRFEDPDRIFAEGGAIEAAQEAKKAGKIRFIGFTGHKDPHIHLYMLEVARRHGFHFDTLLMPLNIMDANFRSFQHLVLPVALREGIGVMSMKPMGGKYILESGVVTPAECLQYAMSLPSAVVISGMDSLPVLEKNLETVKNFKPLASDQMAALEQRTAEMASTGKFERFKVSQVFDSTAQHPQWLG